MGRKHPLLLLTIILSLYTTTNHAFSFRALNPAKLQQKQYGASSSSYKMQEIRPMAFQNARFQSMDSNVDVSVAKRSSKRFTKSVLKKLALAS